MHKAADWHLQQIQILSDFTWGGPTRKGGAIRNLSGSEVEKDIYKISEFVEKPPKEKAPPNLAIMGRYVLTSDIFDSINETEPCISGEIQLTDAPQKLDLI